jgi:hypothetical protein
MNDSFWKIKIRLTLTNFSIHGLISLSISFGKTYDIKFCGHCSLVASLSFLTFFTGSSIGLMFLFLSSGLFGNTDGPTTSDMLLKWNN